MKNPKVVAIDFDETLGLYPKGQTGKGYEVKQVNNIINPEMVRIIKKYRKLGHRIVIYSSRWWGDYNALVEWLEKNKLPVGSGKKDLINDIVLGRLKADLYICDKSVNPFHPEGDMEEAAEDILSNSDKWGIHTEKTK